MKNTISLLLSAAGILAFGLVLGHIWGRSTVSKESGAHPMQSFSRCEETETAFTCSMHPQVVRQESGQCPACGMKLIARQLLPENRPELLQLADGEALLAGVSTTRVQPADHLRKQIPLSGSIAVQQGRIREQVAGLPGRIEELYVKERGSYVQKGQPIASIYSKDLISSVEILTLGNTSEAIMRSARNNIKSWNLDISILREFNFQEGDYRHAVPIKADFSGYVLDLMVKEGGYTANAYMGLPTTMYTIADLSEVWAVFDLYEQDIASLQIGQEVDFTVEAHPGRTFRGEVTFISPVVDAHTHTAEVRVSVPNNDGQLKPGMLAEGQLQASAGAEQAGLAIPKSAVLWTGERSVVYVRDTSFSHPVFYPREISLGPAAGAYYLVKRGLKDGELVVSAGAFALDAAAQLKGKKSMMNRPAPHPAIVAGNVYAGSTGKNSRSE